MVNNMLALHRSVALDGFRQIIVLIFFVCNELISNKNREKTKDANFHKYFFVLFCCMDSGRFIALMRGRF